ncbi:aspartate racemase [Candidatus Symbiopectobacterium sp. 'North America']|uniref:aspartate/glutamate racemase family protein n=1 Tax=Candidatus Symbiopectobacterium sp. 'North America' TaxID=2794574 RepID=UPI0018C92643|nr:amino acid racemase [Candidatus Symbiopectobacterium sp. 'North America']MBG6244753.1 aspartate racemase [Candidatus Symbiopectobacterium sp. 'North America']
MNNLIGILGGMGPGATVDAMQKLINNTPANKDQDHIPTIAVFIPDIPDRTQCILNHGASPLDKMVQYMKILENAGAECIIIPCNTAHFWFDELKKRTHVEMISIIDTTCQLIKQQHLHAVGLLASTAKCKAKIYQDNLSALGIACQIPDDTAQQAVIESIYAYKAGRIADAHRLLAPVRDTLLDAGVEKLILGCTELPLILQQDMASAPEHYIDATDALIKKTVECYFTHSPRHPSHQGTPHHPIAA